MVEATLTDARTQTMYDLDVAIVDTFAVGDGAWVVHNTEICNVPEYALGTLGHPRAAREHNVRNLTENYAPSDHTVFSGVFDLNSFNWLAYPSLGTTPARGQFPSNVVLGPNEEFARSAYGDFHPFLVPPRRGHLMVRDRWKQIDNSFNTRNSPESGLVAFTLFYKNRGMFNIRWTSRSVNLVNWRTSVRMADGEFRPIAPDTFVYTNVYYPNLAGQTELLRAPAIAAIEGATGFSTVSLPYPSN